jgi:conjugal transfer pilus assembly protein TraE
MDIELAHDRSQRVLRQRNVLAGVVVLLAAGLAVTFAAAQSKDREVVLVPTLRSPMTLTSSSVSREYLEMVTRDVAALALNRSPETLTWWMTTILDLTDEQDRGEVKKGLIKIVAEQQGSQISQFFTPDMMTVDPGELTSEVGGTLHTVVASKEVTSEHRTFRFRWRYNGVSLKLAGFGMVTREPAAPGAAQ